MDLRPFQRRFIRRAFAPGIRTAAMSIPRGNGKSTFAGYLAARALTPGDDLYVAGSESVLIGGSIEQCRIVFRAARRILEPAGEHRFLDSATRCAITHKASNTRLRVIGSNAKTSMGLVDCPLAILDEPGAYETIAGALMWDSIRTAQGKPDSPLRAVLIGTIAPATSGWWPDLISAGSKGSTYVMALQGRLDKWAEDAEIKRVNPLMWCYRDSRKVLRGWRKPRPMPLPRKQRLLKRKRRTQAHRGGIASTAASRLRKTSKSSACAMCCRRRVLNAAPAEFNFVGMTVFSSTFGGRQAAVILEAEVVV